MYVCSDRIRDEIRLSRYIYSLPVKTLRHAYFKRSDVLTPIAQTCLLQSAQTYPAQPAQTCSMASGKPGAILKYSSANPMSQAFAKSGGVLEHPLCWV